MSVYSNLIQNKTDDFALRIVRLYKYLTFSAAEKEFVISKQLLRSGTSIGANLNEAVYAQSKDDLIAKTYIALKECSETLYWLRLLHKATYLSDKQYISLHNDAEEILKILITSIKTLKRKKEEEKKQKEEKKQN